MEARFAKTWGKKGLDEAEKKKKREKPW